MARRGSERISALLHHGFHFNYPTPEERYGLGVRHIVGVLGFFAAATTYCQRFSLSLAITEMATTKHLTKIDPDACPKPEGANGTAQSSAQSGEFDWDEHIQGLVLSSFFWGYVISPVLGGWLAEKFGAKHVMGLGLGVSTAGSFLSPIVTRAFGWEGFVGLRFIMGLGQGPVYPCLSVVMANWAPAIERGRMGAIMFAGAQLGNVFSMLITGLIMGIFGWTGGFYVWGVFGTMWLIAWYILFTNKPSTHWWISEKEKKYIEDFSGKTFRDDLPPVPWKDILSSVPLWALIVAQIGHDWGLFTIVTDLPKYLKSVLNFSLKTNALVSGMPYFVMWVFAIVSGWVSDWLTGPVVQWNVSFVRKLFITIASVGPGIGLIAASYSGCNQVLAACLFIFGMGTMGSFIPSLKVNPVDLSPNYAGIVMALVNGIGAVSGIITPYVVGILTPNSFMKEWRTVFWLCDGVLIGTNIIYLIWGTAEVQPWNNPKT